MARLTFTDRAIQALKPGADRVDYFDKKLSGFFIRVTPAGVKTFGAMYNVNGRKRRLTIAESEQGMRDGLRQAAEVASERDIVITMDADESHTPGLMIRMVRMIREGYDVVIASRYQRGSRGSITGNNLQDSFRQSSARHDFLNLQTGQRRELTGLQHGRVTRH